MTMRRVTNKEGEDEDDFFIIEEVEDELPIVGKMAHEMEFIIIKDKEEENMGFLKRKKRKKILKKKDRELFY